jgi:flagellar FliJ protein
MTDRRFPLQTVQELAESREEEAGRLVNLAAARLAEARNKADVLRAYRDQYAQQLLEAGAVGVDPGRWRDTLAFIARIDEALKQQVVEIGRLEGAWRHAVGEWHARTQDLRRYGVLEQRHDDRLAIVDRRVEQRLADELATRRRGSGV